MEQLLLPAIHPDRLKRTFNGYLTTLYLGILLCLLGAFTIDFRGYYPDFSNGSGVIIALGVLGILSSSIMALVLIYRIWTYLLKQYRTEGLVVPVDSPGQAIGFLFVPFYNFYWSFIAYGQIPKCLNKLSIKRGGNEQMNDSLGIVVAAFMLSGIIPYIGWLLSVIASVVLMPVMLNRAIGLIRQIPEEADNTINTIDRSIEERANLYETKDFLQLFQAPGIGYNYKLGLALIVMALLSNFISILILGHFNYMGWSALVIPFVQIIPFAIIAFVYVLLLYKVRNKHIVAVAFGLIASLVSSISFVVSWLMNSHDILMAQLTGNLYNMASSFAFGVILIYGYILGVHLWKFRYTSFLLGKAMANIIPIVGLCITIISVPSGSMKYIASSLVPLVLDVFLGSLAFYLGIKWNINQRK
nr:hypothetical protein [uncultured Carboxylicivirga sp.]